MRAILEPSIEEFAFVTPRDAGSPFFAVSIKYRVNIYLPDGKLADSWGFTGYGTAPAQGLSSAPPLQTATALAMRDAGAKLAVEFREQATVRGLLPGGATADTLAKPARSAGQLVRSCARPIRRHRPMPASACSAGAADGPTEPEKKDSQRGARKREPPKRRARQRGARRPNEGGGKKAPARRKQRREASAGVDDQRPPSTLSLRVRNTSRFVMPVVATGSPLTNFGRKRAARIAAACPRPRAACRSLR